MSERALQIKGYYDRGLWKAAWVQSAVGRGITQAEADMILGVATAEEGQ